MKNEKLLNFNRFTETNIIILKTKNLLLELVLLGFTPILNTNNNKMENKQW